jgi:predicted RNA-binding Zn-ribbon protein involved in translation (DUF1610 family)
MLLIFKKGKGWVHADAGSSVICRCASCGSEAGLHYTEENPNCPVCGGTWIDDHCAQPDYNSKEEKI